VSRRSAPPTSDGGDVRRADAPAPDHLDRLLATLPSWVLVVGKGGVGKTTCAGALAERRASSGCDTLLIATDPARSLSVALGAPVHGTPGGIADGSPLSAMQLDPLAARDAFLARWRDAVITIVDRGTYLDEPDIRQLVDAALPGLDESMALLSLGALHADPRWKTVVVDTAPTGHTLRLLELPGTFTALLDVLDAMQEKHRFMVRALTHRYRQDDADRFLTVMRDQVERLRAMLTDGERCAAVLVTRDDAVVEAETVRYADALTGLGIRIGAVVTNAVTGEGGSKLLGLPRASRFRVPLLAPPPSGIDGLRRWGQALEADDSTIVERAASPSIAPAAWAVPNARPEARIPVLPLTIVAGKGGVGKTTVSCALGVLAARADHPTLVVSTDPAPSVADALELDVGDEPREVPGAPGLFAQQLDATAAFVRLRDRFRGRVDALFDSLAGDSAFDAAQDRRIVRDLLSLAPPGIDEVYALAALGETLAERRFSAIVVDPAPTGHLVRLLEMPDLAVRWSHQLLRLMLKYKSVVGLGDASQELLQFAKQTRALGELLKDRSRASALVVSLDEPLVRQETTRLTHSVESLGIGVVGIAWNRARQVPAPPDSSMLEWMLPEWSPPPRGVAALRAWASEWRELRRPVS